MDPLTCPACFDVLDRSEPPQSRNYTDYMRYPSGAGSSPEMPTFTPKADRDVLSPFLSFRTSKQKRKQTI